MLNENEKRSETTKEKIRSGMLGNKNALKKCIIVAMKIVTIIVLYHNKS